MEFGFIMLRHVNSEITNKYWKESYDCIRNLYPTEKIVIIDDNSNYNFVSKHILVNTIIIDSKYKGRGELLPYIYYIENQWFDNAIIIHDSFFIKKKLDLNFINFKFFFHFKHHWNQKEEEKRILRGLDNFSELISFHSKKKLWHGCFGGMTIINYDFLKKVHLKHNFHKLINLITCRRYRSCFERVLAVMLLKYYSPEKKSEFGKIHDYFIFALSFEEYSISEIDLPVVKVWSGR